MPRQRGSAAVEHSLANLENQSNLLKDGRGTRAPSSAICSQRAQAHRHHRRVESLRTPHALGHGWQRRVLWGGLVESCWVLARSRSWDTASCASAGLSSTWGRAPWRSIRRARTLQPVPKTFRPSAHQNLPRRQGQRGLGVLTRAHPSSVLSHPRRSAGARSISSVSERCIERRAGWGGSASSIDVTFE